MPWFKIDDGFWSHPKTLQLSDGAQALWMRAGSWSMHHLTDGLIPSYALPLLRAKPRFVNELLSVSLWFSDEDGYRFHDWSRYQPTREQVEADRDAAAERKRKSREKSRRDSHVTDGAGSGDAALSPTRPDPTHSAKAEVSAPKRGTRIPDDFTVTPDMVAWVKEHAPAVDGKRSTEMFINHWQSASGRNATKIDWVKAWRNWMLADQQRAEERGWKPQPQQRQTSSIADMNARRDEVLAQIEAEERAKDHERSA